MTLSRFARRAFTEFREEDHPRGEGGKFATKEDEKTGAEPEDIEERRDWPDPYTQVNRAADRIRAAMPGVEITIDQSIIDKASQSDSDTEIGFARQAQDYADAVNGAAAGFERVAQEYPEIASRLGTIELGPTDSAGALGQYQHRGSDRVYGEDGGLAPRGAFGGDHMPLIQIDIAAIASRGNKFRTLADAEQRLGINPAVTHTIPAERAKFSVERLTEGISIHEFGHAAYYAAPSPVVMHATADRAYQTGQYGRISDYAGENQHEYFAEVFTANALGMSDRLVEADRNMLTAAGIDIEPALARAAASEKLPSTFTEDPPPDTFEGSIIWEYAEEREGEPRLAYVFTEEDHPRDAGGKFASKDGGGDSERGLDEKTAKAIGEGLRAKGFVNIREVKVSVTADLAPDALRTVQSTLGDLGSRYPGTAAVVTTVTIERDPGYQGMTAEADDGGNGIGLHFDARVLNQESDLPKPKMTMVDDSPAGLLNHEFGHAMHLAAGSAAGGNRLDAAGMFQGVYDAFGPPSSQVWKDLHDYIGSENPISEYATENIAEGFAELFAASRLPANADDEKMQSVVAYVADQAGGARVAAPLPETFDDDFVFADTPDGPVYSRREIERARTGASLFTRRAAEWVEEDHPRDRGMFTEKDGGGGSTSDEGRAPASEYGLNYQERYVNDPDVKAARAWDGWDAVPVTQVDPKSLVAIEDSLKRASIDKVVSGKEPPLREGYVAQVVRKDDGTEIIVDGHHRAAMASEMGEPLDVKIVDAKEIQRAGSVSRFVRRAYTFDESSVVRDEGGRFSAKDGGEPGDTSEPAAEYRGLHRAPGRDGFEDGSTAKMSDLTTLFPDDIYGPNAAQYYGHGGDADGRRMDEQTIKILRSVRDKPDTEITVYRAAPESASSINTGDWVTPNRAYAEQHMADEEGWHVIEQSAKASDLFWDGNSIHEFGWDPPRQAAIAGPAEIIREIPDKFVTDEDVDDDELVRRAYVFDESAVTRDSSGRFSRQEDAGESVEEEAARRSEPVEVTEARRDFAEVDRLAEEFEQAHGTAGERRESMQQMQRTVNGTPQYVTLPDGSRGTMHSFIPISGTTAEVSVIPERGGQTLVFEMEIAPEEFHEGGRLNASDMRDAFESALTREVDRPAIEPEATTGGPPILNAEQQDIFESEFSSGSLGSALTSELGFRGISGDTAFQPNEHGTVTQTEDRGPLGGPSLVWSNLIEGDDGTTYEINVPISDQMFYGQPGEQGFDSTIFGEVAADEVAAALRGDPTFDEFGIRSGDGDDDRQDEYERQHANAFGDYPDEEEAEYPTRYDAAFHSAEQIMQSALPETFTGTMHQSANSGEFDIRDPEGYGGTLSFEIVGDALHVGSMVLDSEMQDKGVGTAMVGALISAAEQMNVRAVEFLANITVGGYAWARMGAYPNERSWNTLQSDLRFRANVLRDAMGEDAFGMLSELIDSDDPRSINEISQFESHIELPRNLRDAGQNPSAYDLAVDNKIRLDENGAIELGKAMLLGTSWAARVPIGDEQARAEFAEYEAEKEAEKAIAAAVEESWQGLGAYRLPDGTLDDYTFWEEILGVDMLASPRFAAARRSRFARRAYAFDESMVNRDEGGKFATKDGGGAKAEPEPPKEEDRGPVYRAARAAASWWSGSKKHTDRIQEDADLLMTTGRGLSSGEEEAGMGAALMRAVELSPPNPVALFRGVNGGTQRYTQGQDVAFSLGSFSSSEDHAERFAAGATQKPSRLGAPVMFMIEEGDAQAVDFARLDLAREKSREHEYVTGGEFVVDRVEPYTVRDDLPEGQKVWLTQTEVPRAANA